FVQGTGRSPRLSRLFRSAARPADRLAPVSVFGYSSLDHVKIELLHLAADGADAAVADGAAIDLGDRSHLGSGADEKGLISDVQLRTVDRPLDHFQAQLLPGQLDHRGTGDSFKDVIRDRGSDQLAVADDKEVFGAPLRDVAIVGQKDAVV